MRNIRKIKCAICGEDITNKTRYKLIEISGVKRGLFHHKESFNLCANCCAAMSLVNKAILSSKDKWPSAESIEKDNNKMTFSDMYNKLP